MADVIVVGAGVVGAGVARPPQPHRAPGGRRRRLGRAAGGSTGRSFASIRGQWADPLNIEISWRSIRHYQAFPGGIDVGYRPSGYLFLVPESRWDAHLVAVDPQRRHGVPVEVLDVAAAMAVR